MDRIMAKLKGEKHSLTGNNSGNTSNGSFTKKIQPEHSESVISIITNKVMQAESPIRATLYGRWDGFTGDRKEMDNAN